MNEEQQKKWDDSYYKPKIEYGFSIDNQESWYNIPMSVFELVVGKFPKLIVKEKSFYQGRTEYEIKISDF